MDSKRDSRSLGRFGLVVALSCVACRSDSGGAQHSVPADAAEAEANAKPSANAEPAPAGEPRDGEGGAGFGEPVPVVGKARPPGPPGPDSSADELPRLHGQTEASLRAEFGEPSSMREFTMAECCTEFEIELYNIYPPNSGHDNVKIREWTWKYEGYALTVWLHQKGKTWQVLETCRYGDGVEF